MVDVSSVNLNENLIFSQESEHRGVKVTRQKNMQEKYRKHMKWWLDEFCAGDQVDHYVELFPELDSRLAKFAVGIFL